MSDLILPIGLFGLLVPVFARFERQGRSDVVLAFVLTAVAAQAVLYPIDAEVPPGIFRPEPFRLPEVLLAAALVARVLVRGGPKVVRPAAFAWVAFFSWYAYEAVNGRFSGHTTANLLFHGRLVIYVGGAMVIAAGVDPSRLIRSRWLRWWLVGGSLTALALAQQSMSGRLIARQLPGLPNIELGLLGTDAASLLSTVGVVLLLVELSRRPVHRTRLLAVSVLIVLPVLSTQRAALVGLAGSLAVVAFAAVGRYWPRRELPTRTDVALVLVGFASLCLAVSLVQYHGGRTPTLASAYRETFLSTADQQSAEARVLKWEQGLLHVEASPVIGNGLGTTVRSFRPGLGGTGRYRRVSVYDSVPFDLAVRSGVVGLVLFTGALVLSVAASGPAWRRHPDPGVAALALGCTAGVVGLVAKGLVESILDKVVLAVVLGVLLGLMHACANTVPTRGPLVRTARSS